MRGIVSHLLVALLASRDVLWDIVTALIDLHVAVVAVMLFPGFLVFSPPLAAVCVVVGPQFVAGDVYEARRYFKGGDHKRRARWALRLAGTEAFVIGLAVVGYLAATAR